MPEPDFFCPFEQLADIRSACVVAIVRIVTMVPFMGSNDFTWYKVTLAKWW